MSRRKSLEQAVRRTIGRVEAGRIALLADGEVLVCSLCDAPVKPCEGNPDYDCPDKILGATHLKSLLEISREERNGSPARCLLCGKKLSKRDLSGDPLRELCGSCQTRSTRRSRILPTKDTES